MTKIVLSKHALERAKSRKIAPALIEQIIFNPDRTYDLQAGKVKFTKYLNGRHYQIIATELKSEKCWLVISVWVRGEEDRVPLLWLMISAPFRLVWWLICQLFALLSFLFTKIIAKIARKNRPI